MPVNKHYDSIKNFTLCFDSGLVCKRLDTIAEGITKIAEVLEGLLHSITQKASSRKFAKLFTEASAQDLREKF